MHTKEYQTCVKKKKVMATDKETKIEVKKTEEKKEIQQ